MTDNDEQGAGGKGRYVELHASSAFSFLRGASLPESLATEAARLEMPALALLDRDGVYGAPRLYTGARESGIRPLVGAEITMEDESVVPLLVASRKGYENLCQLVTVSKMEGRSTGLPAVGLAEAGRSEGQKAGNDRKRPCLATWSELEAYAEGLIALTGEIGRAHV